MQLRWPLRSGGANRPSLVDAQKNYLTLGVSDERFAKKVREPNIDEPLEDGFRPVDLSVDDFEETSVHERPWPEDREVLYWWRPTFWLRVQKKPRW